jgi:hypothetical protein
MEFPDEIHITGLPFMLQGWNNTYYKTGEKSDGCPIYHLDTYYLYYFIHIYGVKLYRRDGVWVMQRDHDTEPLSINKYGEKPQPDPFGYWTYGAQVVPA